MNQPVNTNGVRAPLELNHVIDELLRKLPREYREEMLAQMAAAEKLHDRVRNELTNYFMQLASQPVLGAEGLDILRAQIVASQSLLTAMALHGNQFKKGTHPLMAAKKEEGGPLDM